jgi:indolepyruvate ferredoxin oxidoreductase
LHDAEGARPAAGLNTAGYVSGYRGSPLGGLDQQFMRAKPFLDPDDVVFQTGLNEDLAATALWGTQQAELRGEGKFDGVFGIWYGKGPGVDRTGDVFRHANFAGSSKHGGVLALMGDDHTAESSTTAHQTEFNFVDVRFRSSIRRACRRSRLRPLWLGDVALLRHLGGAEMRA